MKICYIAPDLGYGGAQKQLIELVANISRPEFEPVVINLYREYTSERLLKLGIRIIDLEYRGTRDFTKVFRLNRILASERPDVLHCFLTAANFYGLLASISTGVRVRVVGERSIGNRLNGIRRKVYPRILPLADAIVTNSLRNQEWLRAAYPRSRGKIKCIPNGCRLPVPASASEVQRKRDALGIRPGQFVIATLTHLTPEKDVECLIRAAARLDRSGLDFKVLIAGEGPLVGNIRTAIAGNQLEERVRLAGHLPHPEALLVAQLCDAFVLTSRFEGMPNAVMEAMSLGRPCVASNVGGVPELLDGCQTGLRFESGDDAGLARCLLMLAGDPGLRKQLGDNGRLRVQGQFSVERMVEMHESLYRSLVEQRQAASTGGQPS